MSPKFVKFWFRPVNKGVGIQQVAVCFDEVIKMFVWMMVDVFGY